MELDENFKHLGKELGAAITESVSDSEKIAEVLAKIRASGYDLFLILEVTIGFNKREEAGLGETTRPRTRKAQLQFTPHDTQFLRALRISVEEPKG